MAVWVRVGEGGSYGCVLGRLDGCAKIRLDSMHWDDIRCDERWAEES